MIKQMNDVHCDMKHGGESGEERYGGKRVCGGCNGHGVMVRRDMEVTEVVEDVMDRVSW